MNNNFSIIISNTSRSFQYLSIIKKIKLKPSCIIYLDDKINYKNRKNIKNKLSKFKKSKLKVFISKKINHSIVNFLLNLNDKNIIYSGYPGIIIKSKRLLKEKNIIHNHPGKLPEYKGSTTIYYSLLKENNIYCSTLIMNNKIDDGKILFVKKYNLPRNIKTIDNSYDDKIRSLNLEFFLKKFKMKQIKKQNKIFLPYYVIHPVLRTLTFKKFKKEK